MKLYAGGVDNYFQLGFEPTTKNKKGHGCVDSLTQVPFDIENIQCVAGGWSHSIIVKDYRVFGAGVDVDFRIGSGVNQVFKTFTEVKISDEPISWAACGWKFTLYLTVNGKAILCHFKAIGERIMIPLDKKAVSVFASYEYGGIIDEDGQIHILDKENPHKPPKMFSLDTKATDLVLCEHFICALASDGRLFGNGKLNKGSQNFVEVSSLKGVKITKISGWYDTCAALSSDGRVYIYGKNDCGQFGNGKTKDNYSSFIAVQFDEIVKDISCSQHILLLTESNKIYGCGFNECYQLFKKTNDENILSIVQVASVDADHVIACNCHSFVSSGTGKLESTAMKSVICNSKKVEKSPISSELSQYSKVKVVENNNQNDKIDCLIELCQKQSQSIAQLTDICRNLQQQYEMNTIEIQKIRKETLKEIKKLREVNDKQTQNIELLSNELKAFREENNIKKVEVDGKLDCVIKYINDLDFY